MISWVKIICMGLMHNALGLLDQIKKYVRPARRLAHYTVNGNRVTIMHRGTHADLGVLSQCFDLNQYDIWDNRGVYRTHVQAFYRRVVNAGKIPLIVDCGANIGASSLWFTNYFPESHIIAIEPALDNLELLRLNCSQRNIEIRAAAIGPHDGSTFLFDPGEGEWGYRTDDISDLGYKVPVLSIETLLSEMCPDRFEPFILKIDIEGAEKSLFAGKTAAIDKFPIIIAEPHDWLFPGEQTASSLFRFHVDTKRDFSYHQENVFSISYRRLLEE
jgi:FkbM family methyltransferase